MDVVQTNWRGRLLNHRKDGSGIYVTMTGSDSLLYFPVIVEANALYRVTLEVRNDNGNGIVCCNIFGNPNFDFPCAKICCESAEWKTYDVDIQTETFPKTLPLVFRMLRKPGGNGSVSVKRIIVEKIERTAATTTPFFKKQEQISHNGQNNKAQELYPCVSQDNRTQELHPCVSQSNKMQELYSCEDRDNTNHIQNNVPTSFLDELRPYVRFSDTNQYATKVLFFAYSYSEIKKNRFGFFGVNQFGLIDAFIDNGYDLCTLFFNQYFEDFGFKKTQEAFIYLAEFYKPDLIFMQFQDFEGMISLNTINEIMCICPQAFTINTSVDIRNTAISFMVKVGKLVHKTLIPSVGQIQMYKDAGCRDVSFWQQGYDPKYFYRKTDKERANLYKKYGHNISFCAHRPKWGDVFSGASLRREIASSLSKTFGNQFGLYGYGWDLTKDEICEESFRRVAGFYETNDIYNSSKLAISVNQINDVEKYWSNRQITAMASGTAVVSRYVPGMEKYFTNGKDILWFKTAEECVDLCKYYLSHSKEAKKIGYAGAKIVKENFTYYFMVKDLAKFFPESLILSLSSKSQISLMLENILVPRDFDGIKKFVENIKNDPKLIELHKTRLLERVLAGFCIIDKEYTLCHRS